MAGKYQCLDYAPYFWKEDIVVIVETPTGYSWVDFKDQAWNFPKPDVMDFRFFNISLVATEDSLTLPTGWTLTTTFNMTSGALDTIKNRHGWTYQKVSDYTIDIHTYNFPQ